MKENKLKDNIIVINRRFALINFTLFLGILFIIFTLIITEKSNENFYGYAIITLVLIMLLIGWIFCPICCVINSRGIKIIYAFGKNEFTDFKQIRKIYIVDDAMYRGSWITRYNYVFDGLKLSKKYMTNEFMKCKKLETALLFFAKEKLSNKIPK